MRGSNELVRVRFDTNRDSHENPLPDSGLFSTAGQPPDLFGRVDDDSSDTELDRPSQLVDRLVVAVEQNLLHRELGALGDGKLTASCDV